MTDKNSNNHLLNIFASSSATACAEIITLPICVVKTNYQTISCNNNNITIYGTAKWIYEKRGIKGFYSASFPAVLAQIISTSGKYSLYRFGTSNDFPRVISGIGAGVAVSLITHPFDFLRITFQRGQKLFNSNTNDKIKLSTFYRGYSKTLTKVIVGSSLFLPIYDYTKSLINKSENICDNGNERNILCKVFKNIHSPILPAVISSIISTIIIQPIDYIKVRNVAGLPWYQGPNPMKYFRGCGLNLLRVVPHFTITMTLVEKIYDYLD